jgi:hypothetical protein
MENNSKNRKSMSKGGEGQMDGNPPRFDGGFDLEGSLKRLQNDPGPENEIRLFREIKSAKFLLPCRAIGAGTDKSIRPAILSTQNNEAFLPAFTVTEELQKWPFPTERVLVLSFDDLKHIVLEDPQNLSGIVLNPFGKMLLLRKPEIAQIDATTEGLSVRRADHPAGLQLFRPAKYPPGLENGMNDFFRWKQEVSRVYLFLARGPEDPEPHWLFLIDFVGEKSVLFPEVAKAVRPYMKEGESFELMKATHEMLMPLAAKSKPIYTKHEKM